MFHQLEDPTIPLFEKAYPGYQGLFKFDRAKVHSAQASDALLAHKMNLSSGGEQPLMRNTLIPVTDIVQTMHENGEAKDLKKVIHALDTISDSNKSF